jgi:diguanylate cyclase (GGDEF)-like protein
VSLKLAPPISSDGERSYEVLLVEDDPSDAMLVRLHLQRANETYVCETVERLEDAERMLMQRRFDAVITDLSLPDSQGLECVVRLQRVASDTPVIVLSGEEYEELALQAVQSGAQDYLTKDSLNPHSLAKAVRYALERKQSETRLRRLALYDQLTGLTNRYYFNEMLEDAILRARRLSTRLAVMVLDLDAFKRVNDGLGHGAGDRLLCTVATRLTGTVREYDTVARLGGDEFGVLVDLDRGAGSDPALLATRILRVLEKPIVVDGTPVVVSASIGVAVFPGAADGPEGMLRAADDAMAKAKQAGAGTYHLKAESKSEDSLPLLQVTAALTHALERNEFRLAYQVQVDTRDRRVVGAEALLRWSPKYIDAVGPNVFIPLLEGTNRIGAVGTWVIREAVRQLRAWRDDGHELPRISVNVSARQFANAELVDVVRTALDEYGVEPSSLELEITESVLMSDREIAATTLRALSDVGCRIALDDFGTGYSSLAYLHRFPVHTLKIDRSFVNGLELRTEAATLVGAIISLGKRMNLEVVAEGVETEEQWELLRDEGCDLCQGYLFGRPVSPDDMVAEIKKQS